MTSTEEVAPGVRRLGSRWVNWYLLEGPDGLTAVDAGLPAHRRSLPALLDRLGGAGGRIENVVLTHWHPDHTGCAEWIRSRFGATVWAPRAEAGVVRGEEKAKSPNFVPYVWRPAVLRYVASVVREGALRPKPVGAVEPYDPEETELPNGLRALATPGHTHGHCSLLHEERGILFCGDALTMVNLLTRQAEPRALPRALAYDNDAVLRSLERLEEVDAGVALPGHGEPWREGAGRAARLAREAGVPS